MKRLLFWSALFLSAAVIVPSLRADVKTTEKTTMKFEGLMGAMMNRMAGGADGSTSTVAVKGNRMSRMNGTTGQGQIIDLTEEKVYSVDTKKKEYTVQTFAQMREAMEKAKAEMAERQKQMSAQDKQAMQDAGKQFEFDVDVKSTGQTKQIAGYDTKESILTITMRQAGKKLEESGGMVMTNTLWQAARVAALDEVMQFNIKFFKAVYGGMFTGVDMQQMNAMAAMMPGMGQIMEKMATEGRKLQGTTLASTMVVESVKSQEQVAAAPRSGGGGLGGMLASKMMRGQSQPRTTMMTSGHETLTIGAAATADDVAIPAGFKEKK